MTFKIYPRAGEWHVEFAGSFLRYLKRDDAISYAHWRCTSDGATIQVLDRKDGTVLESFTVAQGQRTLGPG